MTEVPRVFDLVRGDATATTLSPFRCRRAHIVHSGEGIEVVWVSKQAEQLDPDWFLTETADPLLVIQGLLRVEFDDTPLPGADTRARPAARSPGTDLLPRLPLAAEAEGATIFLAGYPKPV